MAAVIDRDFATADRQALIHPEAEPSGPLPHPDVWDPLLEVKRQDAIRRLGRMWRGKVDCEHRYRNAAGDQTDPRAAVVVRR